MTTKIYVLCEPGGEIRYVGKTIAELPLRLTQHLQAAQRGERTYKSNWVRSLLARGLLPQIVLIGVVGGDGCISEKGWIKYFRAKGVSLVNGTDGGDGICGWKHTDIARNKIRNTLMGRKRPPEVVEKMRIANLGKKLSESTREKIRLTHLGKKYCLGCKRSELFKEKIRLAVTGRKHTLATIKKMRLAQKGRIISKETKRKICNSVKKLWSSPEYRQRISDAHKGKVPWNKGKCFCYSGEALKNMSEAHRGKMSGNKGKHPSEEARKRMSQSHKGKKHPHVGVARSDITRLKMSNTKKESWRKRKELKAVLYA